MRTNIIAAVYLAAGSSSRMGTNKLILPFKKTTIGSSALGAALESKLEHIVVVTRQGDRLEWMDRSFFQQPFRDRWTQIICHEAKKGLAHSIKCGVEAVLEKKPNSIMILLADQPFLQVNNINELIDRAENLCRYRKNLKTSFLAASFHGIPRPPVLFCQRLFPELLGLEGDEGARRLLQEHYSAEGVLVDLPDEKIVFDIDTMEDYRKAIQGR